MKWWKNHSQPVIHLRATDDDSTQKERRLKFRRPPLHPPETLCCFLLTRASSIIALPLLLIRTLIHSCFA